MHIAITGSMGSGKSTVSALLKEMGYPVFSADQIVEELYETANIKRKMVEILGSQALTCMGEIDKAYVSFRIFNHPSERRSVEALIHPLVYEELKRRAAAQTSPLVFSEVPLLFENGHQSAFDQSLLVSCEHDIALKRLVEHRHFTPEEALRRLKTQMPIEEKRRLATAEIKNNGSIQALKEKVIQYLHSLTP